MDFDAFAKMVMAALSSGNGVLLAALALMGLVALFRSLFSDKLPFLKTDLGAALFTLVLGTLGGLATALAGGSALSLALLLATVKVVFTSMGGYSALKKLILPLLEKLFPGLGGEAKKADPAKESGLGGITGPTKEFE